ncbi:MAG TPA: DmsC/YnfH family molybdoenzyme membrane anchor subunit, partial [Polyangia bacterium]
SVFHLGRPLGAWRVFLGLGTSWMSREAIAFGVFAKVGVLFAGSVLAARFEPSWGQRIVAIARPLLEGATAGLGLLGVFCSIMIYVVTRRTHWRAAMTATKFVGTTVVLGAATVLMVSRLAAGLLPEAVRASTMEPLSRGLLLVVAVGAGIKLIFEALQLRHYRDRDHTVPKRVAIVMLRDLKQVTVARFLCGGIGGLLLPLVALGRLDTHGVGPGTVIAVFVLLLSGELCERSMFFKAAPPSRMPGALS